MTWLWVLPLLVTGVGLGAVAVAANRASSEVVALQARIADLRSLHAEVTNLRRDADDVVAAAVDLTSPVPRPAPGADSDIDRY